MQVGTRVIRGPDWSSGIVDGGEGHVGTIQGQLNDITPHLQWDNGRRAAYPLVGKHKLLVLDSGPAGIRHKGYTCTGCGDEDIGGCRWTCSQCKASSLCTRCYGDMVHDLTHRFLRFDTSTSKGVEVPRRCSSVRIQSLGLFPNAVVTNSKERKGKILTVGDHRYGASVRSMVRIQWEDGETGIYRAGHEGEVDVHYVTEYPGMFYYRDHLQPVGSKETCTGRKAEPKIPNGSCNSSTKSKSFTQRDSSTKETAFTQRNPPSTKTRVFTKSDPSSTKPKLFTQGDPPSKKPKMGTQGDHLSTKSKSFTQGDPSSKKTKGFTQGTPSSPKPKMGPQGTHSSPKPKGFTQGDTSSPKPKVGPQGDTSSPKPKMGPQGDTSSPKPKVGPQGDTSSPKPKEFTQGTRSSPKPKSGTQGDPSSTEPKGFTHSHNSNAKPKLFTQSDRVCIKVAPSELREMQKKEGIWNQKLVQYVEKFGKVKHYTSKGHVAVAFGGDVMIICEKALKKIPLLTEGDTVRISSNLDELVQLQTGHGGIVGEMRMAVNKVGVVKKVEDNGCVVIAFGSTCWHFNPACCIPAPGAKVDDISTPVPRPTMPTQTTASLMELFFDAMMRGRCSSDDEEEEDWEDYDEDEEDEYDEIPTKLNGKIVEDSALIAKTEAMFEAFRRGDYKLSLEIMRSDTRLKNILYGDVGGDTLLMRAALNNQLPLVRQLMDEGVNINEKSEGGNIALTCAVISGNVEMVKLFLERGSIVNLVHGLADAPIEVAIKMGHTKIAKLLLEKNIDVNRIDKTGESACHMCVMEGHNEILSAILDKHKFNPLLLNRKGFTILHSAALCGNFRAAEIIVEKCPTTVDHKMRHKFTALHVAANNDRTDCIRVLVDKGKCDINMTNSEGWTALHIACVLLNDSSIACLLKKGADVNVQDKEGMTSLHYVMGSGAIADHAGVLGKPHESVSDEQRIQLSCKLLQNGANPDIKNGRGKTALECAVNSTVRSAITMFIRSRSGSKSSTTSSSETSTTESIFNLPCANCIDARVDIKIQPCGHKFLCRVCIGKVKLCPFCKVEIEGNEDLPNTAAPKTDQSCKLQ